MDAVSAKIALQWACSLMTLLADECNLEARACHQRPRPALPARQLRGRARARYPRDAEDDVESGVAGREGGEGMTGLARANLDRVWGDERRHLLVEGCHFVHRNAELASIESNRNCYQLSAITIHQRARLTSVIQPKRFAWKQR